MTGERRPVMVRDSSDDHDRAARLCRKPRGNRPVQRIGGVSAADDEQISPCAQLLQRGDQVAGRKFDRETLGPDLLPATPEVALQIRPCQPQGLQVGRGDALAASLHMAHGQMTTGRHRFLGGPGQRCQAAAAHLDTDRDAICRGARSGRRHQRRFGYAASPPRSPHSPRSWPVRRRMQRRRVNGAGPICAPNSCRTDRYAQDRRSASTCRNRPCEHTGLGSLCAGERRVYGRANRNGRSARTTQTGDGNVRLRRGTAEPAAAVGLAWSSQHIFRDDQPDE